jgi:hypothetical protein
MSQNKEWILDFDDQMGTFPATARLVLKYNRYAAAELPPTVNEMVGRMRTMARVHLRKPGYICVYGYVIVAYEVPFDDRLHYRACVDASLIPGSEP